MSEDSKPPEVRTPSKSGPAVIETRVIRSGHVESRHLASAAVHLAGENSTRTLGPSLYTWLRSVAKPFQALSAIRLGLAERYAIEPADLAVITASHAGESCHRERVTQILSKLELTPDALRCGTHAPFSKRERQDRLRNGRGIDVLDNNCSGKHAAMLLSSPIVGGTLDDYTDPLHPVQLRVRSVLSEYLGHALPDEFVGVDGCGAPTFFVGIDRIARAFAKLAAGGRDVEESDAPRIDAIHHAIDHEPRLFSGEGRLPYRFRELLSRHGLRSKEGAEGVFAVWGAPGALVIKSHCGSDRGFRYVLPELLRKVDFIDAATCDEWKGMDVPVVRNVAKRVVGEIQVVL